MIRRVLLLILTIIAAFGVTVNTVAAQTTQPLTSVAFMRYYNGTNFYELMVIDPERPSIDPPVVATRITTTLPPRWRPGAGQDTLLFTSIEDKNEDIYAVRADGKKLTNLTKHPAQDTMPIWSPDGRFIAFASDRDKDAGLTEIYVMDADGSDVIRITRSGASGYASHPAWSPDGNSIAYLFHSSKDAQPTLNITNPTGTREGLLIKANSYFGAPVWSPNSKLIGIMTDVEDGCELLVFNADGTNPRGMARFTRRTFENNPEMAAGVCHFVWSLDSNAIIYSAPQGDANDIFMVDFEGQIRNLTNSSADDLMPAFSPDGRQIVFTSFRLGYNLYRMNLNGSGLTPLTFVSFASVYPVWAVTGVLEF